MSSCCSPPPPAAAVVDAVLRADRICAARCDASAIVQVMEELGATDAEGLEALLRHCRSELAARLSGVARLRVRGASSCE